MYISFGISPSARSLLPLPYPPEDRILTYPPESPRAAVPLPGPGVSCSAAPRLQNSGPLPAVRWCPPAEQQLRRTVPGWRSVLHWQAPSQPCRPEAVYWRGAVQTAWPELLHRARAHPRASAGGFEAPSSTRGWPPVCPSIFSPPPDRR